MSDISRRDLLGLMAAVPLAQALGMDVLERAAEAAKLAVEQAAAGQQFVPKFFNPQEWRTVRILVDLIIPRDERSGSAAEAGVPEFMDFTLTDRPNMQSGMRSGLVWLEGFAQRRFNQSFADCNTSQQTSLLDEIAWPARASAEVTDGVRFFNMFRDLTASGFWSSKMGVEDLGYMGNTVIPEWKGCPDEQLKKLGVSYGD